ncbi:MAG: hypothetical protein CL840_11930 [Crocinitomicaceae bacterium]|nr:hypothetical protein [Crocinitomicaceae bacterium]|tara:strand:- start:7964 stop:8734 length:771 start_codon:yes stop_codon:yes gene_type:complete
MKRIQLVVLFIITIAFAGCNEGTSSENTSVLNKVNQEPATSHLMIAISSSNIDSIDKWYLINTNRYYTGRQIRHSKESKAGIEYTVSSFGHEYEDRFVSNFKTYSDTTSHVFEYDETLDSLIKYNYDESRKCDIKTLLWIDSLMTLRRLNEKDIYLLIKSINPYCKNNVEYTQMLNEYLWLALQNHPQKFAFALCIENLAREQKQYVIQEIAAPLNDAYRENGLIDSIQNSKMIFRDSSVVKDLINALRMVKSSYD